MTNAAIESLESKIAAAFPGLSVVVGADRIAIESGCVVASLDAEGRWLLGDDDTPDMEGPMSEEAVLEALTALLEDAGWSGEF
jgi:hypothetical protein